MKGHQTLGRSSQTPMRRNLKSIQRMKDQPSEHGTAVAAIFTGNHRAYHSLAPGCVAVNAKGLAGVVDWMIEKRVVVMST